MTTEVLVADLGMGGDGSDSSSFTRPICVLHHQVGSSSLRHTK